MDKELMRNFLIKEVIPPRNSTEHKKDRLWDAVRKANRDLMTAARTGNIEKYAEANKDGQYATVQSLYDIIRMEKEPLCSADLIKKLRKKNKEIEFGAVQKLVNMTLKYLIIINAFENEEFNICEEKCDCPLDSAILKKLKDLNKIEHECWTKIDDAEYDSIQTEISEHLKTEYPAKAYGNIWFDFVEWDKI